MNIYFICTGNTCRSPMAEAILTSLQIPNVEVKSAGIYALEGGEISENAKSVLEAEQISMDHRSKMVSKDDLEWADLILTMTSAHKELVLRSDPEVKAKIFTLKEYAAPYTSKDISDPFGGDYHQYEQTFQELKQYINILRDKIVIAEGNYGTKDEV
jgi:protein arginine phosphatase